MLSVLVFFPQSAVFPKLRPACMQCNGHALCQVNSVCYSRTVHTSFHVSKKEEPLGDRFLRFVGWLGGFYATKQVIQLFVLTYLLTCTHSYVSVCVCITGE